MNSLSTSNLNGGLGVSVLRMPKLHGLSSRELRALGTPQRGLPEEVNDWRSDNKSILKFGLEPIKYAEKKNIATFYGGLYLRKQTEDGNILDLGLGGLRVVTTAGVKKIVGLLNGVDATTGTTFKYHGLGTGSGTEASTETALVTELTTEYATNNTRPAGNQFYSGGDTTPTTGYYTQGTNTLDASAAVTEHGIFSASSSGTMLDRTAFSVVNLSSGDSLQTTYILTFTAGG